MAIKRIWHGWTTPEKADEYQTLLHNEIFPGIENKNISGYQSIELLRLEADGELKIFSPDFIPAILRGDQLLYRNSAHNKLLTEGIR